MNLLYHLEIPLDRKPQLEEALANAEAQLEGEDAKDLYKQQVLDLLDQIQRSRDTATLSANDDAGLIKLDVIEYSESKDYKIRYHKDDLRYRLSRLIGYQLIYYTENCY